MGDIAITIIDAVGIQAIECLLPDDASSALLAAKLAVLMRYPQVGYDGNLLAYGLIIKDGRAIEPDETLKDACACKDSSLYLVPIITVAQDTPDSQSDPILPSPEPVELPDIEVIQHISLLHDDGLDIRANITMSATAHRQLGQFAIQNRALECAGLLLGTVDVDGVERIIQINAIVPASDVVSTRNTVCIGLHAWASMLKIKNKQYGNLRILGWFHSHAGWGVFMSDADVFMHTNIFPHPNMVAYVIDPVIGSDGFFFWQDGKISQGNYALQAEPKETTPVIETKKPFLSGYGVKISLAVVMLTGFFMLFGSNIRHRHKLAQKQNAPIILKIDKEPHKVIVHHSERVYFLGKRDNLWTLCNRVYNNGDLAPALADYNGLDTFVHLQVGQEIKLPPKSVLKRMRKH